MVMRRRIPFPRCAKAKLLAVFISAPPSAISLCVSLSCVHATSALHTSPALLSPVPHRVAIRSHTVEGCYIAQCVSFASVSVLKGRHQPSRCRFAIPYAVPTKPLAVSCGRKMTTADTIDENATEPPTPADAQKLPAELSSSSLSGLPEKALTILGSTTSSVVSAVFFAVLAYKRDAYMISFFLGSVLNAVAGKILKRVLNQDRPRELDDVAEIKLKPTDKGMPSSHATSLGFICTFTALGAPYLSVPLFVYVLLSLRYRVKRRLHTSEQVYVGILIGVVNAFLWRGVTFGTNYLPFLSSPLPFNMMDIVSRTILVDGILPMQYLVVPALIGVIVVGSFERRISRWISTSRDSSNNIKARRKDKDV